MLCPLVIWFYLLPLSLHSNISGKKPVQSAPQGQQAAPFPTVLILTSEGQQPAPLPAREKAPGVAVGHAPLWAVRAGWYLIVLKMASIQKGSARVAVATLKMVASDVRRMVVKLK
jgi:hypothetical protein